MAEQVNLNVEELARLREAVTGYAKDLTTGFVDPACEALVQCGLGGDLKAELVPKSEELRESFKNMLEQLVGKGSEPSPNDDTILGCVLGLEENVKERVNDSTMGRAASNLQQTSQTKVGSQRQRAKM